MSAEQFSNLLTAIAMLGGAIAFYIGLGQYKIGLSQYNKAETWKRREFLAGQMKEFFSDPTVRNALDMIDWSGRPINLDLDPQLPRSNWPYISRKDQTSALYPHSIAKLRPTKRMPDKSVLNEDQDARFTPIEARIRDTFDTFLDRLEVFESFVSAELISAEELHPYLKYWINDIASVEDPDADLEWTLALFTYIRYYGFQGVAHLFERFGYDIKPDGAIWKAIEIKIANSEVIKHLNQVAQAVQAGT